MRCLEPMIITEILRLKEMNFTLREIGIFGNAIKLDVR